VPVLTRISGVLRKKGNLNNRDPWLVGGHLSKFRVTSAGGSTITPLWNGDGGQSKGKKPGDLHQQCVLTLEGLDEWPLTEKVRSRKKEELSGRKPRSTKKTERRKKKEKKLIWDEATLFAWGGGEPSGRRILRKPERHDDGSANDSTSIEPGGNGCERRTRKARGEEQRSQYCTSSPKAPSAMTFTPSTGSPARQWGERKTYQKNNHRSPLFNLTKALDNGKRAKESESKGRRRSNIP